MLTAILVDVAIHSGYTKDLKEAERLGQEIASWPAHARDLALTGTDSLFGFFRQFAASPGKTSTTPTTRASKRRAPVRRPLDCTGVLFCPGNPGYFSFRPGQYYGQDPDFGAESSEEDGMVVVNAYRIALCNTIGRLAGTCLRQRDLFPLRFSRHVLKYLLGREVAFHDLAFFDPGLYEAQRQLLNDYTEAGDNFEDLDLCFNVKLRPEMGSADIELVPGGKDVAVTPSNVQDFVQRYARLLMIECVQDELDALKAGFLEVIPANLLTDLTAEDLRLLLNGRDHVDLQLLKAATQFKHECNDRELYKATQERFWRVVEGLPQEQQHNLIYFWMSIPSLPATQRGLVPQPVIVIRPQTEDLPTAATCSARLSLPAYASETVLRDKLLLAIATKSFGFI
jgi:E3 ubiquitin-protein ligase EDD1